MPVIDGGIVSFSAFTSVEEVSNTERRVLTRVPASIFDYNAIDASITITGSATMKFASSGRKLRVAVAPTLFEDSSNEDQFELVVGLQSEKVVKDNDVYAPIKINKINSSTTTTAKGSIFIGTMVVALVNAIW